MSPRRAPGARPGDLPSGPEGGDRWYLEDERTFLLRSIEDAGRERDAGDLAADDYAVLVARDRSRLAEVEVALEALGPDPMQDEDALATGTDDAGADAGDDEGDASAIPARRSRRARLRLAGIVAACALIVAGAGILVDHALSPALPGQPSSGSITVSKEQQIEDQLIEANSLNNNGQAVAALQLYDRILGEDPADPEALAASGWLDWNYGNAGKSATAMAAGRRSEQKAIRVAPGYWAGHLYLGLILYNQDHNPAAAAHQFDLFLADKPPGGEVADVAPQVAGAYPASHRPVPSLLQKALALTSGTSGSSASSGGSSTASSTTTTTSR